MSKLIYRLFSLTLSMVCAGNVLCAQNPSTVIRVLDASGVEGIAGVVLLVNPGDARKSQAFVTNVRGEIITHDLQCEICTISAFDPRGLFTSRTTEFSSSSSSYSLVMQLRPLIDTVGDPKAVSIDLLINNPKGEPLAQQNVAIRPTLMTLENHQFFVQKTDVKGHVKVQLRTGQYTVASLNGGAPSEAQFEIMRAKRECSGGAVACIVASPRSSHHTKPVSLHLLTSSLNKLPYEGRQVEPPKQR